MKKIYFITTNDYKFRKFSEAINLDQIDIEQLKADTPEIQAENNRKVAEFSAKWAADRFHSPAIKEDVGLYIDALNGFPGPYLAHVEKQLKTEGFLRLLNGIQNRSAHWEYAVAYCEPGQEPKSFYTQHKGTMAHEARGKSGWYADKIFILEGKSMTVSELLDANEYIRNDSHYKALHAFLENHLERKPSTGLI